MAITERAVDERTDLTGGRTRRGAFKLRGRKQREDEDRTRLRAAPVMSRRWMYTLRAALLITFLAGWEYLPELEWLSSRITVLDPFFISSPSRIVERVWALMIPGGTFASIWPALQQTVTSALLGFAGASDLSGVMG